MGQTGDKISEPLFLCLRRAVPQNVLRPPYPAWRSVPPLLRRRFCACPSLYTIYRPRICRWIGHGCIMHGMSPPFLLSDSLPYLRATHHNEGNNSWPVSTVLSGMCSLFCVVLYLVEACLYPKRVTNSAKMCADGVQTVIFGVLAARTPMPANRWQGEMVPAAATGRLRRLISLLTLAVER